MSNSKYQFNISTKVQFKYWENDIERKTFFDVGSKKGVENHAAGTGCAFGDYDNDGDLDLFVVNGSGPNRVYMNQGNGMFQDVASLVGMLDTVRTRSVVLGDIDDDGDLDPYVVNEGSPNRLYRNGGNSNGWLQVYLRGVSSNIDAIGARLTLYNKDETTTREINGVAGLAQSSRLVQFGLGPKSVGDSLSIVWPRGTRQGILLEPNARRLDIIEGRVPTAVSDVFSSNLKESEVFSNFPNPFNASTRFPFFLREEGLVRCSVYNVLGQYVRHLVEATLPAGSHYVEWDGFTENGLTASTGIYFYRFEISRKTYIGSMSLVR